MKTGLYDPASEHDACGVGMVVNIRGDKTHELVDNALTVLENMSHRHRYEFNNRYREEYETAGMQCVGVNPDADLVEIVEIPSLRWYIGTQFHPEYSSTVLHPHPLFVSFVKACIVQSADLGRQ